MGAYWLGCTGGWMDGQPVLVAPLPAIRLASCCWVATSAARTSLVSLLTAEMLFYTPCMAALFTT